MRRLLVSLLLLVPGGLCFTGCSSSHDAAAPGSTGQARFTIRWPQRTRLIPVLTQSLKLSVWTSGSEITRMIERPLSGDSTTMVFDGLTPGSADFTAEAYADQYAQGAVLAKAQAHVTIVEGQYTEVVIAMNSAITELRLSPGSMLLQAGASKQIVLTAHHGSSIIPVSPSMLRWSTNNPSVARVEQNGMVTALSTGNATVTVTELESNITAGALITVSDQPGRIVFQATSGDVMHTDYAIYSMNIDGSGRTRLAGSPTFNRVENPCISRDGTRIAFSATTYDAATATYHSGIYVMKSDGSGVQQLTNTLGFDDEPVFSPDGRQIAYTSGTQSSKSLYLMQADGTHAHKLTTSTLSEHSPTFSPDGGRIAFSGWNDGHFDIYQLEIASGQVTRLTNGLGDSRSPAFSPDKDIIAFESKSGGSGTAIFLMDSHGGNLRQVTNPTGQYSGDHQPWFSPDGQRLTFLSWRNASNQVFLCTLDGSATTQITNSAQGGCARPTWGRGTAIR